MEAEGVNPPSEGWQESPEGNKVRKMNRCGRSLRFPGRGRQREMGGRRQKPGGTQLAPCPDEPGLAGWRAGGHSPHWGPEGSSEAQGCWRQKQAISSMGRRKGVEDSLGTGARPCNPSGERPGAQEGREPAQQEEEEAKRPGPGIGKPRGGLHADSIETN